MAHAPSAMETVDGTVRFVDYPFSPATARRRAIRFDELREVDPYASPAEIRTHAGERLFAPVEQDQAVEELAAQAGVPVVRRLDVWAEVLEPFLDSSFTRAERSARRRRLASVGLPPRKVRKLRHAAVVTDITNMLGWEWSHLGQADLLADTLSTPGWLAYRVIASWRRGLPRDREAFYWWTMEVAELGEVKTVEQPLESEATALRLRLATYDESDFRFFGGHDRWVGLDLALVVLGIAAAIVFLDGVLAAIAVLGVLAIGFLIALSIASRPTRNG